MGLLLIDLEMGHGDGASNRPGDGAWRLGQEFSMKIN